MRGNRIPVISYNAASRAASTRSIATSAFGPPCIALPFPARIYTEIVSSVIEGK